MKKHVGFYTLRMLLALLFLAGAARVSFAQATLDYEARIAAGNGQVRWSNCQFAPDGTLYVVYGNPGHTPWAPVSTNNPIWMVTYDGTTASTPFNVTGTTTIDAFQPDIAISKSGLIAVVWGQQQADAVYLRTYDPVTKAWSAIETVAQGYGNYEPAVVFDSQNNVFMSWFTALSGGVCARAKINGSWEEVFRHPAVGLTKQQHMAVGPDDVVHMVWIDKNYGTFTGQYSKRSRSFAWTAPESWKIVGEPTHPSITITPDNTAWVSSGEAVEELEAYAEIWVMNLYRPTVRFKVGDNISQHYPHIQSDSNGKLHVAIQAGGNDIGYGVFYANNLVTDFKSLQLLSGGRPMQQGIHSDGGGNTAICWSSITTGDASEIWIASLKPISPTKPPVNAAMTITHSGVLKGGKVTYNLSWSKNPSNRDDNLTGYKIYAQDTGGAWTAFTQVSVSTLSTTIELTSRTHKMKFAVCSVAKSGFESDRVQF
jgi:hypothetical protein